MPENRNITVTGTGSSGSSSTKDLTPASEKSRDKKHGLRIPGMPPLGLSAPTSLLGTPYTSSHAPPFEYPFPSPSAASTPPHIPLYIPSLASPSHSPFPFGPTLLSRGQSSPFVGGSVNALGLGFPTWKRSSSPPHSRFAPSRVDPPVPPGLKEKVQSFTGVSADETGGEGREKMPERKNEGVAPVVDFGDEPGMAFDREQPEDKSPSRPESPDPE